ncbi:MAG: 6-phosphogluconolactonase [Aquiluna sp.]|nr:6-phosphogluconolactonase [Aquiluna sp.]
MIEVESFASDQALTAAAASDIIGLLEQAIALRGKARLVLTGGTLGIKILGDFRTLGIDLSNVELFFGDERFVGLENADRNEHQGIVAWPELSAAKLHRFPEADRPLENAAGEFNSHIESLLGTLSDSAPVFDVVILGMGPDGHIASLFPGHQQAEKWIIAEKASPKPPAERLSFSYQALNRARAVIFLASGNAKAAVAKCAIQEEACDLPAAKVKGLELTRWYVDEEISREL